MCRKVVSQCRQVAEVGRSWPAVKLSADALRMATRLPSAIILTFRTFTFTHHPFTEIAQWSNGTSLISPEIPLHFNPTRDYTLTSIVFSSLAKAVGGGWSTCTRSDRCPSNVIFHDTELGIIHRRSPPVCASRSHSYAQSCQAPISPLYQKYRPAGFLFSPLDQHIHTERHQ